VLEKTPVKKVQLNNTKNTIKNVYINKYILQNKLCLYTWNIYKTRPRYKN